MLPEQDKCDYELGLRVKDLLIEKGVETPVDDDALHLSSPAKIDMLTKSFKDIWTTMGMDLKDDSLCDTPKRMAKMFVNELYYGLDYKNFPKCTVVKNKMGYDEVVTCSDITVMSACEHHGSVISGKAIIAYLPAENVLGLSKFNRIVDFFSRRPQIQERLTEQIFWALTLVLGTENIAIRIVADHYCVKARGAQDNSETATVKLGGVFKLPSTRNEFLLSSLKNSHD